MAEGASSLILRYPTLEAGARLMSLSLDRRMVIDRIAVIHNYGESFGSALRPLRETSPQLKKLDVGNISAGDKAVKSVSSGQSKRPRPHCCFFSLPITHHIINENPALRTSGRKHRLKPQASLSPARDRLQRSAEVDDRTPAAGTYNASVGHEILAFLWKTQ